MTQDVDLAQLEASALGVSVDQVSSFSKASWEVKLLVVFHILLLRYFDD